MQGDAERVECFQRKMILKRRQLGTRVRIPSLPPIIPQYIPDPRCRHNVRMNNYGVVALGEQAKRI